MTLYEQIINILTAEGINTDKYTEEIINTYYNEALNLIDAPYTKNEVYTDYRHVNYISMYSTDFYPVLTEAPVNITLDNKTIIPRKITHDGRIYFYERLNGVLEVEYTVGLNETDINNYIAPLIIAMIKDREGLKEVSSINEGDISVSYNTGTAAADNTSINGIIEKIKNKYKGRVRII